MLSFRFLLMLLCCMAMWSCNSVLGVDDFESAKCTEGEKRCAGNEPERCSNGVWRAASACNGQTCIDGACVGVCAPGKRCLGVTPQYCDAQGTWVAGSSCQANEHCEGGECALECVPLDLRCWNNAPQLCNEIKQWQDIQGPCEHQACNPTTVTCEGTCAPEERQCNGSELQVCNASGDWQQELDCQTGCVDGACITPCTGGQMLPSVELCDGLDNDCNGIIDDGIPGIGDSCFITLYAGTPCYEAKLECSLGCNGLPECVPITKPGFIPEICDGVDNDCNGIKDDGFFCCPDGKVSGNETDLDCGGSCAQKCADGKGCFVGIDCISGNCYQNNCKSASCMDGLKNGAESDIDCGGVCPMSCLVGNSCLTDNDCVSKLCQPASKTCIQKPTGSSCLDDVECNTGYCVDTVCCDSACTGLCRACNAVLSGAVNGLCSNISAGSDPQNECAGTCDGLGACQP